MRILALLPLPLLTSGCLAPGQRDPTRYPWDQPQSALAPHQPIVAHGALPRLATPLPRFVPPPGTYCVVAIEPQARSGITVGGKAPGILNCGVLPSPPPAPKRPR
jgi:hypothetical protein